MFLERPKFSPRTPGQTDALSTWRRNQCLLLTGPAGTGKTFLSVALALERLAHKDREHQHLYLCRPAQPAGEDLGFLPGTDREKVAPYLAPIHDALKKLGVQPDTAWRKGFLVEVPLAFLQGWTFDGVAILDEAQNCSLEQLNMFLTRMGDNTKLILSGDWNQHFGRHRNVFESLCEELEEIHGVGHVRLGEDDIVRHPLIKHFLAAVKRVQA